MKKNNLSRSENLLMQTFTMRHKTTGDTIATGGQVDTDVGTAALWSHLEREGFVIKATRSGKGILGHYFSRKTTPAGDAKLAELIAQNPDYRR